jgi:hypothetical protein
MTHMVDRNYRDYSSLNAGSPLGYAIPAAPATIDQTLSKIDDQISLLAKYVDEVGTVANMLCGSEPTGNCIKNNAPAPVPNGLREKLGERESRLNYLLTDLGASVSRLSTL